MLNELVAGVDYCGYCKADYDEKGECNCNGFGHAKGSIGTCGYCGVDYFIAPGTDCDCDGFGNDKEAAPVVGHLVEMHPNTSWGYEQTRDFLNAAHEAFGEDCDYWSRYPVRSAEFSPEQQKFISDHEDFVSVRDVYEGQEIYSYRAFKSNDAYSIREIEA